MASSTERARSMLEQKYRDTNFNPGSNGGDRKFLIVRPFGLDEDDFESVRFVESAIDMGNIFIIEGTGTHDNSATYEFT